MQSTSIFDSLKSQLSLKNGLNKIHFILLVSIVLLLFFLFSGGKQTPIPLSSYSHTITEDVLQAIYEQNIDKKLEYAESKPIILSMEKYLHQFEAVLQSDLLKANANLIVINRRLYYLRKKGLKVTKAKKILFEVMEKVTKKRKDN